MAVKEKMDAELQKGKSPVNSRFPRIVVIIIVAEFCERFSYSGMRAFLTLYLRSKLGYSDDGATEIYHIFSTLVYLFPIFGGIVSDNYLGKYRTILYMMFVYAAGNLLVAVTAIPQLELPGRLCTLIGLLMITIGTGGIKPCVTAFGGDQFRLPEQERHLTIYFSVLYTTLCIGSLIAKTVSPILRSEVTCFGDKDCYSLAFGAPGVVVILSMIIFVSAKSRYLIKQPEGNIVFDFIKCVALGLKNKMLKRCKDDKSHWIETTYPAYDKNFIADVKRTLSILSLFCILPVFWSLLDQLGSRWTLQATKMNGKLFFVTVKPDQMQVLVPTCIIIFIPIAQKYIYPSLEKHGILKNPLHKLTLGGVLAGIAFIASGLLEIYLKTTYPQLPSPGLSQIRIFNNNPCSISLHNDNHSITYTIPKMSHYTNKNIQVFDSKNLSLHLGGSCIEPQEMDFLLEENKAISFVLFRNEVERFEDNVDKSKSGFPVVRFLTSPSLTNSNITLYNERKRVTECSVSTGVTKQLEVFVSAYSLYVDGVIVKTGLDLGSGGVYTVMLDKKREGYYATTIATITEPNSITMALLLPQFLIMSIAEVLFAVTGNEFAFKEAPETMKSVISAMWLLTEAAGNVLIIIITRLFAGTNQETQFFIYTGLIFASMLVFHYMSRGYKMRSPVHDDRSRKSRSDSQVMYNQVKQTEDCLDH